jgi:hypothetical protein
MSHQPFSDSLLLQHLESIAAQLGIEIRYESLFDEEVSIRSGGCKVYGRKLIVIDLHRPLGEKISLLAREISRYDLEDLYILPRVREFILHHSSPREKNLPQR